MKKTTNVQEEKVTIEMNFEELAAISVAIIGEIIDMKTIILKLKEENKDGKYDEAINAAKRRIETLENIKKGL